MTVGKGSPKHMRARFVIIAAMAEASDFILGALLKFIKVHHIITP